MDNSIEIYVDLPFDSSPIEVSSLTIERAKALAEFLPKYDYASFIEARIIKADGTYECLVLDLDTHGYQHPKADIRYKERIAIVFDPKDHRVPFVYALREDFPRLPHMNRDTFDSPKSICIYDQPFSDIKLTWTPYQFLGKIRLWFEQAATGNLHEDGQRLEAFFTDPKGYLLLPHNFNPKSDYTLYIHNEDKGLYYCKLLSTASGSTSAHKSVILTSKPTMHGALNIAPKSFTALSLLLESIGIESNNVLKHLILTSSNEKTKKLLIFIVIPTIRQEGQEVESTEVLAFISFETIEEIGISNDLFFKHPDTKESLPSIMDTKSCIIDFPIGCLIPIDSLTQSLAKIYNNISSINEEHHILIGAGAIGSQVFRNLSKMGYGTWDIIDNDFVSPHNLAKHALSEGVFNSKATEISVRANRMLGDNEYSKFHVKDALYFDIPSIIKNANTQIIDSSASVSVARKLAAFDFPNRCTSIFISPSGKDLVIIQEDNQRKNRLDDLEMQYLHALINDDLHKTHLDSAGSIRYAASCRAVTNRIPQDYIALHSAIASKFIRSNSSTSASISIWSIDENDLTTNKQVIPTYPVTRHRLNEWIVVIDELLISKLYESRSLKLPNETGGLLFGSYDIKRKIVYVVDFMRSPNDSTETPRSYKRGIEGVGERIEEIKKRTIGQITYIGEWHSHPDISSLNMSEDDKLHYQWVKAYFEKVSLPPLTLIVGDNDYSIYCNVEE